MMRISYRGTVHTVHTERQLLDLLAFLMVRTPQSVVDDVNSAARRDALAEPEAARSVA